MSKVQLVRQAGAKIDERVVKSYGKEFYNRWRALKPFSDTKIFNDYANKLQAMRKVALEKKKTKMSVAQAEREVARDYDHLIAAVRRAQKFDQVSRDKILKIFKCFLDVPKDLLNVLENIEKIVAASLGNTSMRSTNKKVMLRHLKVVENSVKSWQLGPQTDQSFSVEAKFDNEAQASAAVDALKAFSSNVTGFSIKKNGAFLQFNIPIEKKIFNRKEKISDVRSDIRHAFSEERIKEKYHQNDYELSQELILDQALSDAVYKFSQYGLIPECAYQFAGKEITQQQKKLVRSGDLIMFQRAVRKNKWVWLLHYRDQEGTCGEKTIKDPKKITKLNEVYKACGINKNIKHPDFRNTLKAIVNSYRIHTFTQGYKGDRIVLRSDNSDQSREALRFIREASVHVGFKWLVSEEGETIIKLPYKQLVTFQQLLIAFHTAYQQYEQFEKKFLEQMNEVNETFSCKFELKSELVFDEGQFKLKVNVEGDTSKVKFSLKDKVFDLDKGFERLSRRLKYEVGAHEVREREEAKLLQLVAEAKQREQALEQQRLAEKKRAQEALRAQQARDMEKQRIEKAARAKVTRFYEEQMKEQKSRTNVALTQFTIESQQRAELVKKLAQERQKNTSLKKKEMELSQVTQREIQKNKQTEKTIYTNKLKDKLKDVVQSLSKLLDPEKRKLMQTFNNNMGQIYQQSTSLWSSLSSIGQTASDFYAHSSNFLSGTTDPYSAFEVRARLLEIKWSLEDSDDQLKQYQSLKKLFLNRKKRVVLVKKKNPTLYKKEIVELESTLSLLNELIVIPKYPKMSLKEIKKVILDTREESIKKESKESKEFKL